MTTVGLTTFVREATNPLAAKLALVAFGGDLVFAALRAVQLNTPLIDHSNSMVRLDIDGSYPEMFQYVKFFAIAALMAYLAFETGRRWYFVWAASFLFLMLDDALMFHERVGELLAPRLASLTPEGVDTGAVAEFGYFAVVGIVIAGLALAGILAAGYFRRFSIDMIMLLAVGAFFAVSVDFLHGLATLGYVANNLFAIVEDGGEMLVISVILVYSAMVVGREGQLKHWLTDVRGLRN